MSHLRQIKVGIGSYSENSTVVLVHGNSSFTGAVNISGIVTAASFAGGVDGTATNATNLNNQAASYYLDYDNFTNTPTIPTNNNELTNGAGYITTSFTNTNQLTNGAGFITSSDNITGTSGGLSGSPSITVTDITSVGNVSIAGTLTYEDVTNVDSIGIATARTGLDVLSGGINVTGVSTFQGDVNLGDNDKIRLGDLPDMEIFHDGVNSLIDDVGEGGLVLRSDTLISLKKRTGDENHLVANPDGAVELYHNNSKKLETGQFGVIVTGSLAASNIDLVDNAKLLIGTGDDLQIYHNGSDSFIQDVGAGRLYIQSDGTGIDIQKVGGENLARFITDGAVELYHNNLKKFETTGYGVTVFGTTESQQLNVTGVSTFTNKAEVRSDDGSQGRIDFYCEVSNAHYTRIQAAAHADYSGNAVVTLPSSTGTLLLTDGDGSSLTSLNASNLGSGTIPDARFPTTLPAVSGQNLTGLTGASAATYGSSSVTPVITVDSNGRITGISTAAISDGGGGGISNVVEDTTPQLGGTLDTNGNLIQFGDSSGATDDRLQFGASQDLQIYHDGGNSWVREEGTGALYLDSNGSVIKITKSNASEEMAAFYTDGAVELYYDNSKKFETTSTGITVTGSIVKSGGTSSQYLMADGSVTTSSGGGGSSGIEIENNGTSVGTGITAINFSTNVTATASGGIATVTASGGGGGGGISNVVEDATPQLGGTLDTNGNLIQFGDSSGATDDRLQFGASQDLEIYHDGSNSIINDNGTGNLKLVSNGTAVQIENSDGENIAIFKTDGSVGIGTDNPQRKFVVSDDGTEGLEFYPGDGVNGSTINVYNRATASFTPFSLNAQDYRFSPSGGAEAVRITSTGLVGIGTDNPRTNFQVGAFGSGSDSNIQLATGTSGASNILFGDGSGGSDYYKGFIKYNHSTDNLELYSTDEIIHYANGTERLRITSTGITVTGSIVKSGGTSSQYLMADGSVTTSSGGGGGGSNGFAVIAGMIF